MKHLILIIGIICGFALSSCLAQAPAEQPGPGPEAGKLESYKIAFLSARLNLTPVEAQRFWPIYNQYTFEIHQAQQAYRNNGDELAKEEAILNIRKKYNFEFSRVLPRQKVNMFFHTENDFNNFVRREWMQRRQQRLMQQPRRPLLR